MKKSILLTILLCILLFISVSCGQINSDIGTYPNSSDTIEYKPIHEEHFVQIIPFEKYCAGIKSSSEFEVFKLTWPSDDKLCDLYNESQGDMTFTITRDKTSKKIVSVHEEGSYCQGDSEYGYYYLFDNNGNAIYSMEGGNMYNPTIVKFYENGIEIVSIEHSHEVRAHDEEFATRKIKKSSSTELITSEVFYLKISELKEIIRERITALDSILQDKDLMKEVLEYAGRPDRVNELKEEIQILLPTLENSVRKNIDFTDDYVYEKSIKVGSQVLITRRNINVRNSPSSGSKVVGSVSYYDLRVFVSEIGEIENIAPYGKHNWIRISYTEIFTGRVVEGWIFGAFIISNSCTKQLNW